MNFELKAKHIPGIDNRLADHLSRWDSGNHTEDFINEFGSGYDCAINQDLFLLSDTW